MSSYDSPEGQKIPPTVAESYRRSIGRYFEPIWSLQSHHSSDGEDLSLRGTSRTSSAQSLPLLPLTHRESLAESYTLAGSGLSSSLRAFPRRSSLIPPPATLSQLGLDLDAHDDNARRHDREDTSGRDLEEGAVVPGERTRLLAYANSTESPCPSDDRLSSMYGSRNNKAGRMRNNDKIQAREVRLQVVVWHIGVVDVVLGSVNIKFRITAFWTPSDNEQEDGSTGGYGMQNSSTKRVWVMHGRQRAYERNLSKMVSGSKMIYVPPISILNASSFDVIGEPEVCLVKEETRLMRWTCLYSANLVQENMRVDRFPHDRHDLVIKLGILKHRGSGKRWDMDVWKLGLATEADSQGTTRVPHGLLVDHVMIPEFSHSPEGLQFQFVPLSFGSMKDDRCDECLQISLQVFRDSSYYDKNIVPLLAMLNIVAISVLTLDASDFGDRGAMILATAFVEIGIRLTVDSHLPHVGYQIKIQRIMNNFFFNLLYLTLESSAVYLLSHRLSWPREWTDLIDLVIAVLALAHTVVMLERFYYDLYRARRRLQGDLQGQSRWNMRRVVSPLIGHGG